MRLGEHCRREGGEKYDGSHDNISKFKFFLVARVKKVVETFGRSKTSNAKKVRVVGFGVQVGEATTISSHLEK